MTKNLHVQDSAEELISNDAREQFWRSHVKSWASSGLSQAKYCRQNTLIRNRFGYWKRRFSKENLPIEFIQLPVEPIKPTHLFQKTEESSIRITMNSEFAVEVSDNFLPETLEKVLLTLKRI